MKNNVLKAVAGVAGAVTIFTMAVTSGGDHPASTPSSDPNMWILTHEYEDGCGDVQNLITGEFKIVFGDVSRFDAKEAYMYDDAQR